jgi:hypothetical protein
MERFNQGPRTLCPLHKRRRTVHPRFFMSPYISSFKSRVCFVPEKTHCQGKCARYVLN